MKTLKYYLCSLCDKFIAAPPVIRFALLLIMLLVLLYLVSLSGICIIEYKRKKKEKRYRSICAKFKEPFEKIISSSQKYTKERIHSEVNTKTVSMKSWEKANLADLILSIKQEKKQTLINEHNSNLLVEVFSLQGFYQSTILHIITNSPYTKNSSFEKKHLEDKNKGYYMN